MAPLVSIIVPAFNAERFLAETLESALAQTWPRIETIVIDDGSTDSTLEIAQRYESKSIYVISVPHRGAAAARNIGLQAARGEFIQFLDADDLVSENKIEEQVKLLQELSNRCVCLCKAFYLKSDNGGRKYISEDSFPNGFENDPPIWLINLWGRKPRAGLVPCHSWLVPRALISCVGPWCEQLSVDDDGEFFTRVALAAQRILYTDKATCFYRRHAPVGGTLSGRHSETDFRSALKATQLKAAALLARCDTARAKAAIAQLYQELAFAVYPEFRELSNEAARSARQLASACDMTEFFGRPTGRIAAKLLGWKIVRHASVGLHRMKHNFMCSPTSRS